MQIYKINAINAATRSDRGLRFFSFFQFYGRRPLFTALAIMAAAIRLTILLFPYSPVDYESYRGVNMELTGTVCGLEQKLEGDSVVWRMMLSDVRTDDTIAESVAESVSESEAESEAGSEAESAVGSAAYGTIDPGKRGRVLCVLDHAPGVDFSARVRLRGTLYPFRNAMNEGEFDIRQYYHILRVEYSLRDVEILAASAPTDKLATSLFHLKNHISERIDRLFSTRNSAVLKAMLLGEKGLLEEETEELYQGAGIVHILSISGLHLALIGMGLFSLTGKIMSFHIPSFFPALFKEKFSRKDPRKRFREHLRWHPREHLQKDPRRHLRKDPRKDSRKHPREHLRKHSRKQSAFPFAVTVRAGLSIFAVFLYGKMIGMGTSAFRALVMLSLYIISKVIGRTYDALTAAGIASILLLFDQPLYLLHTGFQFSFGAVLAIGILLPALPGRTLKTAAIPLVTLPVYLWSYGTFPICSLLLNMLVIPLMTAAMVSAGGAVMFDALSGIQPVSRLIGLPAELILDFYRFLAETSSRIPFHEIVPGRPSTVQTLFFYIMLCLFSAISVRLQMPHMRRRIEVVAACRSDSRVEDTVANKMDGILLRISERICLMFHLYDNHERKFFACICSGLWLAAALFVLTVRRTPAFEMDVLYVGQGDGIFVSCEGRYFLIDGGSSTKEELAKYTLLPFLHCKGVSHLDGIIITHEDGDHCSGLLEFLEAAAEEKPRISISAVYLPDIAEKMKGEKYRRIEELSAQAGIPVRYISRGQRIRAGNLTMDCLHPARSASYANANEYSTTLLLRYTDSATKQAGTEDTFSALLTGDIEGEGEKDLCANLQDMDITVLKVAHHGSRNATSEEFLKHVHPQAAVISAGVDNLYGHPNEATLQRLESCNSCRDIYRTDLTGEISMKWEKKKGEGHMFVQVYRK